MNTRKVVFITGATSGFGLAIAQRLVADGHLVFGTSRSPGAVTKPLGFELIELDITSDNSVRSCIRVLLSRTPTVDVVINNAGMAVVGAIEETSLDQARLQVETNFWGTVRLIKEILPLMRRQRKGHIINICSLAGLIGVPFQGFYSASKHALEGYTRSLQYELEPFKIALTLVEPGFFRTSLHHSFVTANERVADYDGVRQRVLSALSEFIEHAPPAEIVADLVARIVRSKKPKFAYRVGTDARFLPILAFFFPTLYHFGTRRKFRLAK